MAASTAARHATSWSKIGASAGSVCERENRAQILTAGASNLRLRTQCKRRKSIAQKRSDFCADLGFWLTTSLVFDRPSDGPKASRCKGTRCIKASAGSTDNAQASKGVQEWPLPTTSDLSVEQARGACQRAIADGKTRLQIELLLPLIGATDLDDWPGGIKQQFKAAVPLVYSLLRELVGTSSAEASKKYLLDEADAVGVWESNSVALVLFPNADTVPDLERLARVKGRPLLIMNPQWQAGQVISDFGFGARRRTSEEFLATFEPAYLLQQKRMQGEDVRILRCYPGPYQVYLTDDRGKSDVVTTSEVLPSYKEIDALLRGRVGSRASKSWLEKLMGETKFNLDNKL